MHSVDIPNSSKMYFLPTTLKGGLTLQQINTTLSLVSIAENSMIEWWKTYNYIENIHDGRGYTISIVGFCTGTGDFIMVLNELKKINPNHILVKYIPAVEGRSGGNVNGLEGLVKDVTSLGIQDSDFNTAVWRIIQQLYWDPAMEFCAKKNLSSALAKYIAYDTFLNFGTLEAFEKIKLDTQVNMLSEFLTIKQKVIEHDKSLGDTKDNRVAMQRKLLMEGNLDLHLPMTVSCYKDVFNL